MPTVYDFTLDKLGDNPGSGTLPLAQFKGQPLLVVNTASRCGFTPQYAHIQSLWRANRDKGLVVLGVPSNDFGGQEPGDSAAIANFCTNTYGVDFPLVAKAHVRGPQAHPLFQWLARQGGFLSRPRWNFYKYVIGRDGELHDWFSSITSPATGRFLRAVDHVLRE